MSHHDITAMTIDQAIGAQPVLLSEDTLDQVNGGARPAFGDFDGMFKDIQHGIRNGATHVSYHRESQTVGGKTKTVTQSSFRR
ncbi:hypothetical protein [Methylorubrum zatmanii]